MHILIKYCCIVHTNRFVVKTKVVAGMIYDLHITRCRCNSKCFRKKYNGFVDIYSLAAIVPIISDTFINKAISKAESGGAYL